MRSQNSQTLAFGSALNIGTIVAATERRDTYVEVLLRSELIKSSSEECSLLKNLGSWLGKSAIGGNQSLRAREIDPKSLMIEACTKGLMVAIIPFTLKAQFAKSIVMEGPLMNYDLLPCHTCYRFWKHTKIALPIGRLILGL